MTSLRDFEYAGWQTAAEHYEPFAALTRLFVEPLLDAVEARSGTQLLDIACGTGVVSQRAVARGAATHGIDFAPNMVATARRRCPEAEILQADAEALPFADARFDAVVSNFGIHHVEHPDRALVEARRVLKPGAHFALTLWASAKDNPTWRLIAEAVAAEGQSSVPMPAGNIANTSPDQFIRLATAAGFSPDRIEQRTLDVLWRLPAGTDLVDVFMGSTVRMATLLRGQSPDAQRAIRAHVAKAIEPHTRDGEIALPTRGFLLSARA
jgi:ubiquinone/menaquinone biosynthesis C-methylase UbiE